MSTKIGILSDVHADAGYTRAALSVFQQQQVNRILCAGDVAGYGDQLEQTVELLVAHQCDVIQGNHDVWFDDSKDSYSDAIAEYLHALPMHSEYVIDDKKI